MVYNGNNRYGKVVSILKKILAAIKDKTNWGSLTTLVLALAGAIASYIITREVLSLAVGLIAVEFFLLVVVHLEDIHGALKRLESRETKGAQLKKWDKSKTGQIIEDAEDELFFCGYDLSRLLPHRAELLAAADRLKRIRLLAMDIDDARVREQIQSTYCRPPSLNSLEPLNYFLQKKNIEIHTVKFPVSFAIHVSARDMQSGTGQMRVMFLNYGPSGYDSPCVELAPADGEWYKHYKGQIELLWNQSSPWQPM